MIDHHASWGYPKPKPKPKWGYSRSMIAALILLAVALMATTYADKAIGQAVYDYNQFQE